jgi:hypothetical protein
LLVGDLGKDPRVPGQRLPGQVLTAGVQRLLRLGLQLSGGLLQLIQLQLDALAAGGHVREPPANLLQHLHLLGV